MAARKHIIRQDFERPSSHIDHSVAYSPELSVDICSRVAAGVSLRRACDALSIPLADVYGWLSDYSDFKERYARATEMRADGIFEGIYELEAEMLAGEIGSGEFKAALDARKWLLSRMSPKKYGDASKSDISGSSAPSRITVSFTEGVDE